MNNIVKFDGLIKSTDNLYAWIEEDQDDAEGGFRWCFVISRNNPKAAKNTDQFRIGHFEHYLPAIEGMKAIVSALKLAGKKVIVGDEID